MYTKYLTITIHQNDPSTKQEIARQKHRNSLYKGIKVACGIIGLGATIALIGLAGALEQDTIAMGRYIASSSFALGLLLATIVLNSYIDSRE